MNMIIVAGVCGLIIPIYLILLMADGRKLQERLRERRMEPVPEERRAQRALIKHASPVWTALRFRESEIENSPPDQ